MDDEKLILLVQERTELYNKYNPLFKSIDKKEEAWQDIAHEMATPGLTAEDCMKRWSCIRDRFTRECKKLEQSSDKDAKVFWPYFEMMDFIRPFVTNRPFRRSTFSRFNRKMFQTGRPPPSPVVRKHSSPPPSINNKHLSPSSPTPSTSASPTASPTQCREFTQIFDDPLNEPPLPHMKITGLNSDVDKSFCEAVEALKKACALNEARHANPAVHAFGEMIVSTICSMSSRNQLKAMQQVTDTVMRIKLEEDELMEQVSYTTLQN